MLAEGVEDHTGFEAVGQGHRVAGGQARGELADHAGDVEERGQREDHCVGGQLLDAYLAVGVEGDVAVGVQRALGASAGARGVADQGGVAGGRQRYVGARPGRGTGGGEQVLGVVGGQPARGQYAGVVAGLEVEFAGGERDTHRRGRGRGPYVALPGVLGADQSRRLGVGEDVGEFVLLVHRVDRDDRAARLPGREQRHNELRHVLQHDGEPVAGREAAGGEVAGQAVGKGVEFAVRQSAVEICQCPVVGAARGRGEESVQDGRRVVGVLALLLGEEPEPRLVGVSGHPSSPAFARRSS